MGFSPKSSHPCKTHEVFPTRKFISRAHTMSGFFSSCRRAYNSSARVFWLRILCNFLTEKLIISRIFGQHFHSWKVIYLSDWVIQLKFPTKSNIRQGSTCRWKSFKTWQKVDWGKCCNFICKAYECGIPFNNYIFFVDRFNYFLMRKKFECVFGEKNTFEYSLIFPSGCNWLKGQTVTDSDFRSSVWNCWIFGILRESH